MTKSLLYLLLLGDVQIEPRRTVVENRGAMTMKCKFMLML